jgi:Na+/phosphate symporter
MQKQLRGDSLKNEVRKAIKQLAKEAGKKGLAKINISRIAEIAGTSRTSLYKMTDFINTCIAEVKAERRMSDGSSEREKLARKVKLMQVTIKKLELELQGIRQHHVNLYRQLYANSSDLSELVKPILIQEADKKGACCLCGHIFQIPRDTPMRGKVVKLANPTETK